MKKVLLALLISITPTAFSFDVFGEMYGQDKGATTGKLSVRFGDIELSKIDGGASIALNKYIAFTNIELGYKGALTYSPLNAMEDYRRADIVEDVFIEFVPYIKVGSDLFVIIEFNSSNNLMLSAGFELF